MDESLTVLSAQVHFLDTKLALIHIPLELYSFFIEPILQLLLPAYEELADAVNEPPTGAEHARSRQPWAYDHPFVNVSLTPVECSVVCPRKIASELFVPVVDSLGPLAAERVAISHEDFIVIQVDGEGFEAGQRVLELTSPLAMNGISIFFITTYFSDYILVPNRLRATVISALEDRGFIFEENSEAFVNVSSPLMTSSFHGHSKDSPTSPTSAHSTSFPNPFDDSLKSPPSELYRPPRTPPPTSVAELESRTFALLARRGIRPTVDPSVQLVQCAGRKDTSVGMRIGREQHRCSYPSNLTRQMHLGLVRCLVRIPRPRFFSATLTDTEPASLLIERQLLTEFENPCPDGGQEEEVLLGCKQDILIPITLDLRELPMESTGIVCGVAGRLSGTWRFVNHFEAGQNGHNGHRSNGSTPAGPVEMSYLSTARAGTVVIAETDLDKAMHALGA